MAQLDGGPKGPAVGAHMDRKGEHRLRPERSNQRHEDEIDLGIGPSRASLRRCDTTCMSMPG
eukprot:10293489-Lingulodinium_polyedra.AAC.1